MRQRRWLLFLPLLAVPLAAQRTPQWRPTLDRTITADEAGVSRIGQLLVLPSGEIAMLDSQEFRIDFIGPSSPRPTHSFGRDGEGPGEFANLRWIGWHDGAIWAEDPNLKRVTFLNAQEKLVATVAEPATMTRGNDTVRFPLAFVQGIAPDGSWIVFAVRRVGQPRPSWATESEWNGTPYLRVGRDGRIQSVMAWVPASGCRFRLQRGTSTLGYNIPFCTSPLSHISSDGGTVAVAVVDQSAHTYRVSSMNSLGDTVFSRTFPYHPVPIPAARWDSALTKARNLMGRERVQLPGVPRPDGYPPIDQLVIGRDGTVWLGGFLLGATRVWHVLDHSGMPIGDVTLPGGVTVAVADRGQLWGIAQDVDGNESIVHYTLAPAR